MKLITAILIEQLHRFVFDYIYIQREITIMDAWVLKLYHALHEAVPDWRTRLKTYFEGAKRYQRYNG